MARQLYHPYGTVRYAEGTLPTDFTFTGQRAVVGTGLMFYKARYYHPGLGRFVSADTVVPDFANPQSLNRYSYVYNNVLKFTDPTGHCVPGEPGCHKGGGDPLAVQPVQQRPAAKIWLHPFVKNRLTPYLQDQTGYPSGCAPFSMAMGLNLLLGANVSGVDMEAFMELTMHKPLGDVNMGMPTRWDTQAAGLNHLAKVYERAYPNKPSFVAEQKTGGTTQDLIDNLNKGYISIVSVSWGAGSLGEPINGAGHALVVVGYDPSTGDFAFLDPLGGELVETAQRFQNKYGVDFEQAWLRQPNWFSACKSVGVNSTHRVLDPHIWVRTSCDTPYVPVARPVGLLTPRLLHAKNKFIPAGSITTTLFCHSEEQSDEESRSMKANCRPKTRFFAPYGRSE